MTERKNTYDSMKESMRREAETINEAAAKDPSRYVTVAEDGIIKTIDRENPNERPGPFGWKYQSIMKHDPVLSKLLEESTPYKE